MDNKILMSFDDSFRVLMDIEKGYSNHKNDYGGETKYGISKRSYPQLDIPSLTIDQAKDVYYRDFWLTYHLDKVRDPQIATQLLLITVNCSPQTSGRIVQKSINRAGGSLIIDGIIGTATVRMINQVSPSALGDALRVELVKFYIDRVNIDSTQKVNFEGWVRRAML